MQNAGGWKETTALGHWHILLAQKGGLMMDRIEKRHKEWHGTMGMAQWESMKKE
jgi:hypothetical protein